MIFDYKKNARPLLFKEKCDDYPYSLGGTCFLFQYDNHSYIVTAKHCLKDRDIASLIVLINPWDNVNDIYPFSFTSPFHILPNDDTTDLNEDYLDVIFYPVDSREITDETARFFIPFKEVFDCDFSLERRTICVVGYPDPAHGINYEKGIYESATVIISAEGVVKRDDFMYEMQLPATPLASYNGFSGAPVYSTGLDGNVKIIGMVLRGGVKVRKLLFLDIRMIRASIHGVLHRLFLRHE